MESVQPHQGGRERTGEGEVKYGGEKVVNKPE